MATIVFLDGVDPIAGSRQGVTFDKSQAGPYAKKRPSPTNPQTQARNKLRAILKEANAYFWNLTWNQKNAWHLWADANGITGPYGCSGFQAACAGFFTVQLNARLAADPHYIIPPGNLPLAGVTFTNLTWIAAGIIRADFNPSPAGANNRVFLRQALPGPGYRRWSKADGYIAEVSGLNQTSPMFFTPKFLHWPGWNGRYWTGTQETTGRRSTEDLWDL